MNLHVHVEFEIQDKLFATILIELPFTSSISVGTAQRRHLLCAAKAAKKIVSSNSIIYQAQVFHFLHISCSFFMSSRNITNRTQVNGRGGNIMCNNTTDILSCARHIQPVGLNQNAVKSATYCWVMIALIVLDFETHRDNMTCVEKGSRPNKDMEKMNLQNRWPCGGLARTNYIHCVTTRLYIFHVWPWIPF